MSINEVHSNLGNLVLPRILDLRWAWILYLLQIYTKLTLMLQTHSVEKRVRGRQM